MAFRLQGKVAFFELVHGELHGVFAVNNELCDGGHDVEIIGFGQMRHATFRTCGNGDSVNLFTFVFLFMFLLIPLT